jgi:hypothetical protein
LVVQLDHCKRCLVAGTVRHIVKCLNACSVMFEPHVDRSQVTVDLSSSCASATSDFSAELVRLTCLVAVRCWTVGVTKST